MDYTYNNSMKDFTADIHLQEFLQWTNQQKNQTHETDPQLRQLNSRKGNAAEADMEAVKIRSITTAKA